MTAFNYIAVNQYGKEKHGVLEADSATHARQKLRNLALLPIEITEVNQAKNAEKNKNFLKTTTLFKPRLSNADLTLIIRQMATLIAAKIPVDQVLKTVSEQTEKPLAKRVLLGVRSKVLQGYTLADSMSEFPKAFPKLFCTTISAGEKSGKLDKILLRLAEYSEKQQKIRRKIQQALLYPALMTIISIFVVVFLLIYVVPKVIDVFSQTHQVLPLTTIILINISKFMKNFGFYGIFLIIISLSTFFILLKKHNFRFKWHQSLLKLPLIGKNISLINSARFARTLGILTAATVPILEGMQTAAQLIEPLPMREAVQNAIQEVREGKSINRALQNTGCFSPLFIHLLGSGEASGQLDHMLAKAAENQEESVENTVNSSLTLFEPIMILVMGCVVLFIVLAIMLPIFSLDQIGGLS